MREYYIFQVKEEFKQLYQQNQVILYQTFKQIYQLPKEDVAYGYSLFKQLTKKIDKEKIDYELFLKLHGSIPYSKKGNTHYINNLYRDEISTLKVKSTYIQIHTNKDYTEFFEFLYKLNTHYFVCDFKNQDYFFLEDIKALV